MYWYAWFLKYFITWSLGNGNAYIHNVWWMRGVMADNTQWPCLSSILIKNNKWKSWKSALFFPSGHAGCPKLWVLLYKCTCKPQCTITNFYSWLFLHYNRVRYLFILLCKDKSHLCKMFEDVWMLPEIVPQLCGTTLLCFID